MRAVGFTAEVLRGVSTRRGLCQGGRADGSGSLDAQSECCQAGQCRRPVLTSQEGLERVRFGGTQEWVLGRVLGEGGINPRRTPGDKVQVSRAVGVTEGASGPLMLSSNRKSWK